MLTIQSENKDQSIKSELFGKIQKDFYYYARLWESLSQIYPSSKYGEELAQISMSLQKIYEKVTLDLKSCKISKENNFNVEQEETR